MARPKHCRGAPCSHRTPHSEQALPVAGALYSDASSGSGGDMTTIAPVLTKCDCCGAVNELMVVGSSSSFGFMDLDTRPPPLLRDTLAYEVQRCENCAYCAPSLDAGQEVSGELVNSEAYQELANDESIPEPARSFRCAAWIAEEDARLADAGWLHLKAAWALDDLEDHDQARDARLRALEAWQKAKNKDQLFAPDEDSEALLVVDVTRRAGLFDQAEQLAAEFDSEEEFLVKVMDFERDLIGRRDHSCHTVEALH